MWNLCNESITSIKDILNKEPRAIGFIYKISYTDGTFYIGKKNLWRLEELLPKSKGLPRKNIIDTVKRRKNGKLVTMEIVLKESDWMTYTGSHHTCNDKEIATKEILQLCVSKIDLTYSEIKHLCNNIEKPNIMNEHIDSRIYRDRIRDSKLNAKPIIYEV